MAVIDKSIQRTTKAAALVLTILLFTSCMSFNDDYFDPVARSLGSRMPEISLEREMAMDLSSGFFDIIDLASAGVADVSELDKLRIAVYKVIPRQGFVDFPDEVFSAALRSQGTGLEWERIVRVREQGEQVWVFAGLDVHAQMLDAVCVFVLDQNELVLINMEGELEHLLEAALQSGKRETYTPPPAV